MSMLLKLANTEMHMWDNSNCAHGREENADGRDRKYIFFFCCFGDYLNVCHFASEEDSARIES